MRQNNGPGAVASAEAGTEIAERRRGPDTTATRTRQRGAGVRASNLRRIGKNTLFATFDLEVPTWRLKFKGCLWHRKGESEWIAFPAREWINKEGIRQFADLIEITDRDVKDRFLAAALEAVHALIGDGGEG